MAVTNWLMAVGAHHCGICCCGLQEPAGVQVLVIGKFALRLGRKPLTARAPWTKRKSLAVFMDS